MLALLDLDGTLIDRDAGFALWLDEFTASQNLSLAETGLVVALDKQHKRRADFFTALAHVLPQVGSVSDLWAEYRERMPSLVAPFDGVTDRLRDMRKRGWRLVVVTNGQAETQLGKLARCRLDVLVDDAVVSETAGSRKPEGAIFRAALGAQAAADAWMVGDDAEADVVGASAVGMRTVWISHGSPWSGNLQEPDQVVINPADAFAFLLSLPPPAST